MVTVTIKGKEFKMAPVPASRENFAAIGMLMGVKDFTENLGGMMPEIGRMIEEALIAGNGEKKGREAFRALSISMAPGSDLSSVIAALIQTVVE